MKQLYHIITLLMLLVAGAESQAQIFYSAVTINVGSTTDIELSDTYARTLRNATNVNYRWWTSSSSISIQSRGMTSCNIKGVSPDTKVRLNFDCSYLYDGFPRTMNFYWEITVRSSDVAVTSIDLSRATASLFVGETLQLSAVPYPRNATNQNINWSTDNYNVASVNSAGLVTARGEGNTRIWVRAADGGGAANYCSLTVKAPETVKVNDITLSESSRELQIGESFSLTATVKPDNATNKSLQWDTSNPQVATVAGGRVTATGEGECYITCISNSDITVSAQCRIIVRPVKQDIKVESITLSNSFRALEIGESFYLTATIMPENADNSSVSWTTSNHDVAEVTTDGRVIAIGEGECVISCAASDGSGVTAECQITVRGNQTIFVTNIAFSRSEIRLDEGTQIQLTAYIYPENATNKSLNWVSDDTDIATIDSNGLVTARKDGATIVWAKAVDGSNCEAHCLVIVGRQNQPSIRLSDESATLEVGDNLELTPIVYDAPSASLLWQSDNTDVATVTQGRVKAVGTGECNITCTIPANREIEASCHVTVVKSTKPVYVSQITVSYLGTNKILVGESKQLEAMVYPYNATNKKVRWRSSDWYASVNDEGVVTGIYPGVTIIYAEAIDGSGVAGIYPLSIVEPVRAAAIDLSREQLILHPSRSAYIYHDVLPKDTNNKDVIWTTSDPDVAVYENGQIYALAPGECTITCTSADNPKAHRDCHVTVKENNQSWVTVCLPDGNVSVDVTELTNSELLIKPLYYGYEVHSVTINGEEQEISDNKPRIKLPWIDGTYDVNVVFKNTLESGLSSTSADSAPVKVVASGGTVTVSGCQEGATIRIYDTAGKLIKSTEETTFELPRHSVYIMRIGGSSFKFAL